MSWRIGTLLQAGGCILLALQALKPPGFVLPLGNAVVLLHHDAVWPLVDRWLAGLSEDHFVRVLPLVRRAVARIVDSPL